MPSKLRMQRIADRIREELSEMMIKDIKDPRMSTVSITDVKVDRELAFADIFVSSFEGSQHSQEILKGFRNASGFIRHALTERIELRVFPQLRFHWDPTPERADHIEHLLASIRQEIKPPAPEDSQNNEQRPA